MSNNKKNKKNKIDNNENNNNDNNKFKILIIGNNSTGKSSLLRQYVDNCFEGELWQGVEIKTKEIIIKNKNRIQLIFDFNGSSSKSYFKQANGIILVYSLSDLESYNSISYWLNEIKKYTIYNDNDEDNNNNNNINNNNNNIPPKILIVGNKSDLPDNQKFVDPDKAKEFCDLLSIPSIHNVSAKCTTNVQDVFFMISTLISNDLPQQTYSSKKSSSSKTLLPKKIKTCTIN